MRAADMGDLELDTRPRAGDRHTSDPVGVGSMFEQLVDRLFLRALQFMLGGVAFGIAFFPVRGRGSAVDLATAAVLLALASGALVKRRALLAMLARRPVRTLLFPLPAVFAVAVDGGFDSVWTPLVAITVGVPATLGLPWLSLGCASIAAVGQAAAAWLNRGDLRSEELVEAAIFNALGTIAAGVGISLSVATMATSLRHRPQILRRLRAQELLAGANGDAPVGEPAQLPAPSRSRLSPAELRVVDRLAAGHTPKQIARELGVTINTVRSHLKEAKRKTGSRTLDELVGLHVVEEGRL